MGAIGKIIIGTVGLIFSIFIITTIIPNQIHQQQALDTETQQTVNQLNQASIKLVNDCMSDTSIGDLSGCKSTLTDLRSKCQSNPDYSSMSVCSDQSITQFFSTVDSKIAYAEGVISNDSTKMVDLCVHLLASGSNSPECISDMQNIQQSCNQYNIDNHMTVCSDPRINEILSGSISSQLPNMTLPNFNQTNQNASSIIQSADQYTLSFIDSCMKATDSSVIQSCSKTAKLMLNYCNNISSVGVGQICNDPRLAQLANVGQTTSPAEPLNNPSQTTFNATTLNYLNNGMQKILDQCINTALSNSASCISGINLVKQDCSNFGKTYPAYFPVCNDPSLQQISNTGQITNPTSTSISCPTPTTYDVTIIKNSLGNSLFNPYILNLQGGDYVIFKSSDGKPHLLTSSNGGLRDWFVTNGALINNDQNIKLPIMIFGDSEKFLDVFDGYNANIHITLDVKPTPTACSK